jgi:flagellin
MANTDVGISSSVRQTLSTLQRTSSDINTIQNRLATGLRVTSALDNPSNFFAAKSLNNRAGDLTALQDSMGQGISTIKAAAEALTAIEDTLTQMKGLADQAKSLGTDTSGLSERSTLATQFNTLITRLDDLASDATYKGVNLIKSSPDSLTVKFNETATSTMVVSGANMTASVGLSVAVAAGTWATNSNVDTAATAITSAINTVRSQQKTFGSELSFLQIRSDFTSNMVRTLKEGAGKLVNADLNEEGANMLALQTKQSLATTALSLTTQSEQSVLRLFG